MKNIVVGKPPCERGGLLTTLKVISVCKITPHRRISIKKEIIDLLDINIGDEILYILDENGIINIRKFKGDIILGKGEKYISSSSITPWMETTITSDIRQIINADIGDNILLILDNKGNIIIRNTVILDECSINIFNKDITALIIGVSSFYHQNKSAAIPKEIMDILGVYEGDKVILSLDEYGNITVSKEIGDNLLQEIILNRQYPNVYLKKKVVDIINPTNKILWYVDEKINIIIKNNLLPDNCI